MPETGREGEEMAKLLAMMCTVVALFAVVAGSASANGNPNGTGQPSQSCQAEPAAPGGGNSSVSSGSPFQGASSAGVYANGPGTGGPGTATGTGHITNPNAVSQYDVACYQVSIHH
jgi:hypothetical protein